MKIYYSNSISDIAPDCEMGSNDILLFEDVEKMIRNIIPFIDHHQNCRYYTHLDLKACDCGFKNKRAQLEAFANKQPFAQLTYPEMP
jgi:hypothetical protein